MAKEECHMSNGGLEIRDAERVRKPTLPKKKLLKKRRKTGHK
jgi:hypothetical protein